MGPLPVFVPLCGVLMDFDQGIAGLVRALSLPAVVHREFAFQDHARQRHAVRMPAGFLARCHRDDGRP